MSAERNRLTALRRSGHSAGGGGRGITGGMERNAAQFPDIGVLCDGFTTAR